MEKKIIDGNTLIEMGYTPGKWFAEAIDYIKLKKPL